MAADMKARETETKLSNEVIAALEEMTERNHENMDLSARLATLLPLARAAVACWIECEMYNLQPTSPWRTLIDAVGALSPELRAELEGTDDADRG